MDQFLETTLGFIPMTVLLISSYILVTLYLLLRKYLLVKTAYYDSKLKK